MNLALLVWFRITTGRDTWAPLPISRAAIKAAQDRLGLDCARGLSEMGASHAFTTAVKGVADSYEVGGVKVRFEIRDGLRDAKRVWRHIYMVRTQVTTRGNSTASRSEAARVADFQFTRPHRVAAGMVAGSERIRTVISPTLDAGDRARVELMVGRVMSRYHELRYQIGPQSLRHFMRAQMTRMGGAPLIDGIGGAYLLPPEAADRVEDLGLLLAEAGDQCYLHSGPVPDVPQWRRALVASLDLDLAARASSLTTTVRAALAQPNGPPKRPRSTWRAAAATLQERATWAATRYDAPFPAGAEALEVLMDVMKHVPE